MRAATRVVVALALVLSGCTAEVEERYTNKLVSCSVSIPQDWRDALTVNEVRAGQGETEQVVAASDDGRRTLVQTWPANQLTLYTEDRLRLPVVSADNSLSVVEFDGHKVKFAVQHVGHSAKFFAWDAKVGGEPVPVAGQYPEPELYRSSDGTTTVSTEDHRLFAERAGRPQPRLVAEIQKSDRVGRISQPRVHGDFVSWWGMDSSYVTDLRTGASVHTSKGYVLRVIGGALVLFRDKNTSATPLSALSPLPGC